MTTTATSSGQRATSATSTGRARGKKTDARGTGGKAERVAQQLQASIDSGELPPGAPLPSEADLMDIHQVSPSTVRKALDLLRGAGLVTTLPRRGSFVRGRRVTDVPAHNPLRTVTPRPEGGFADTDVDSPDWRDAETPSLYQTTADADLALSLNLGLGEPLFVYARLMVNRSGRRMMHRAYLPVAIAAEIPELEDNPGRTAAELYTLLADADHRLGWVESVRAWLPSPDDAQSLRIPPDTPMLLTRRVTNDMPTGRPLLAEETRQSAEAAALNYVITAVEAPDNPTA